MNKKIIVSTLVILIGLIAYAEDIKTKDGQVFKNAKIVDSNPTGIDIEFKNKQGCTVLKGLTFKNLPETIGQRYSYNPQNLSNYKKQVGKYKGKKMEDVISEQKKQIMQLKKELKGKHGDFNVHLKHPDNEELIFSRRSSVRLKVVGVTSEGVLARIEQTFSGPHTFERKIMVEGLHLSNGAEWSGFIYPLGMQARYQEITDIPLYSSNLQDGIKLVNDNLNMYGDYSVNANSDDNNEPDINYNEYYGGEPSYYIDNPYPVYWYHNNYWHHHNWHNHHWHHHHPWHPPHHNYQPHHEVHSPIHGGRSHHSGGVRRK